MALKLLEGTVGIIIRIQELLILTTRMTHPNRELIWRVGVLSRTMEVLERISLELLRIRIQMTFLNKEYKKYK